MNWNDVQSNPETQKILLHWQKLGQFRKNHPAIGAGIHQQITVQPYTFSRTFAKDGFVDKVVIGLDLPSGAKELSTGSIFSDGTVVRDAYSGKEAVVKNGKVTINSEFSFVLLELKN